MAFPCQKCVMWRMTFGIVFIRLMVCARSKFTASRTSGSIWKPNPASLRNWAFLRRRFQASWFHRTLSSLVARLLLTGAPFCWSRLETFCLLRMLRMFLSVSRTRTGCCDLPRFLTSGGTMSIRPPILFSSTTDRQSFSRSPRWKGQTMWPLARR